MKRVTEVYLLVVAIFIISFSDTAKDFTLEIEEFSLETDEFLNG
ncbi:hypothetical protein [Aquimarina rubra]|uniref:Uncharacterized protein n=1 Tax=Aquimarina rubra TaxID=1920033 RepID=A0ABW5LIR8_9FLAO